MFFFGLTYSYMRQKYSNSNNIKAVAPAYVG